MTKRSRTLAWNAIGLSFVGATLGAWDLNSWLPFVWPLSFIALFFYLGRVSHDDG